MWCPACGTEMVLPENICPACQRQVPLGGGEFLFPLEPFSQTEETEQYTDTCSDKSKHPAQALFFQLQKAASSIKSWFKAGSRKDGNIDEDE